MPVNDLIEPSRFWIENCGSWKLSFWIAIVSVRIRDVEMFVWRRVWDIITKYLIRCMCLLLDRCLLFLVFKNVPCSSWLYLISFLQFFVKLSKIDILVQYLLELPIWSLHVHVYRTFTCRVLVMILSVRSAVWAFAVAAAQGNQTSGNQSAKNNETDNGNYQT